MKKKAAPWQRLGINLKLGLRARDESNWLPFNDLFGDHKARSRQLAAKSNLLKTRHNEVFSALPSADAASAEVLEMIIEYLHTHHQKAKEDPNQALHPLEAAARLTPEDLLILEPRQLTDENSTKHTEWCLVAGALCFPAHWLLEEKMDKPLGAIHGPVPHYDKTLDAPVNRFFNNMKIGPISTRMNWSLQSGDALFSPIRAHQLIQPNNKYKEQLYVRIENQTLRKLPQTGQILFTIRTHLAPVANWCETKGAIEDLLAILGDMSPEMQKYKGTAIYETRLRQMLPNLSSSCRGC